MPMPRLFRTRHAVRRQTRAARLLEVERLENRTSLSVDGAAAATMVAPPNGWQFGAGNLGFAGSNQGTYLFVSHNLSGMLPERVTPDYTLLGMRHPENTALAAPKWEGPPPDQPGKLILGAKIDHLRALYAAEDGASANPDEPGEMPPPPVFMLAQGAALYGQFAGEIPRFSARFTERAAVVTELAAARLDNDPLVPLTQQIAEITAPGRALVTVPNPEAQQELAMEMGSPGLGLFVATGSADNSLFQTPAFRANREPAPIELSPTLEPALAVESFWGDLLNGPDSLLEPMPASLQQVTELVPLPGSALGLIAMVETAAAESQGGAPVERRDLDDGTLSISPASSGAAWASFVMGLDEGFDQERTVAAGAGATVFDGSPERFAADLASIDPGAVACYWPIAVSNEPTSETLLPAGRPAPATAAIAGVGGLSPQPAAIPSEVCGGSEFLPRGTLAKLKLVPIWAVSFLSASASAWLVGWTWTRRSQRASSRGERPLRHGLSSMFSSLWTLERRAD